MNNQIVTWHRLITYMLAALGDKQLSAVYLISWYNFSFFQFHVPVVVQLYGTPIVSDDKKMIKVSFLCCVFEML